MRILAVSLALAGLVVADPAAAVDRLVDDGLTPCTGGPIPIHATIGDAVAAATDGDTILVCSGTYSEHVVVDKTVQLQAQGLVSLVSPGTAGSGFLVTGPDVVIEGFDVSGYTLDSDCGIRVVSGAGADIGDNRVHGNRSGLCVEQTAGAAVHNNVAEANTIDGIFVAASAVVVSANATRDNGRWGVNAVACTARLQISRNLVLRNDGGGILANDCTGAVIVANTVRGDNQPGAHGIMATGGEGVSVRRNLVQFTDIGLLLENQDTCVASFNSISFNDVGIELRSSSGCRITRNNVSRSRTIDCRWDGIPGTIFSANSCGTEIPPGAWD